MVTVNWITAFLDTAGGRSVEAEVFWLVVTGTRLSAPRGRDHQFATLLPPDGDAFLRTQAIESALPGVHVDLHVSDAGETARHAVSLNAAVVADHGTLVGLTSPGGLPFCLVSRREEHQRPKPVIWPGGCHSLVDQVCLDIPSRDFAHEACFWSSLTGWPRRPGSRPEFEHLQRPSPIPLRILLQRVSGDGPVHAHLDLACDDIAAETARHEALGATVVRHTEAWTTLRDPTERDYCITSRDPRSGHLGPTTQQP